MKKLAVRSTLLALAFASFSAQAYEDVYPSYAYEMALNNANTYIVDVRTDAEWRWVGHPGVNLMGEGAGLDDKVFNISFKIFKKNNFIRNPSFVSDIKEIFQDKANVTLITMCKAGSRSKDAAAALETAGYNSVYNMVTGFEGEKDAYGYQTVNGWKVDGLPYKISGTGEYDD
jgi:rhodanese-related sulfurtransferase